jgi:hypothetical protein
MTDPYRVSVVQVRGRKGREALEIRDSVELVAGVPVMVVTPALVEIAKANGLPVRYAGVGQSSSRRCCC